MKIKVNDVVLTVRNIDTARIRDLAELQTQSGMMLPDLRKAAVPGSVLVSAILAFLSMRGAGHAFTWDDALDLTNENVSVVFEPGDIRTSDAPAEDPQSPSGASVPDGDAPEAKPQAASARPRKQRSPGSTTK